MFLYFYYCCVNTSSSTESYGHCNMHATYNLPTYVTFIILSCFVKSYVIYLKHYLTNVEHVNIIKGTAFAVLYLRIIYVNFINV